MPGWVVQVAVLLAPILIVEGWLHWRIHDLTHGDVAWETKVGRNQNTESSILVEGDRAYIFSFQVLTILELSSGRNLAEQSLPQANRGYLGTGGQVAIGGLRGLALYSKGGKEIWRKDGEDLTPIAMTRNGEVVARDCSSGTKRCVEVLIDTTGRKIRTPSEPRSLAGTTVTIDNGMDVQMGVTDRNLVRLPTLTVSESKGLATQLRGGRPVGEPVHTIDDDTLAQSGDLLVGLSRTGSTCTFEAVRAGRPQWSSSTRCPALDFPYLSIHDGRVYATDLNSADGGDRYNVVTTDLDGQKATTFTVAVRPSVENAQRRLWTTPDAVVVADTDRLVAYSPAGKKLWQTELPCKKIESTDGSKTFKSCESVQVTGNRVVRRTDNDGTATSVLAIGRDLPPDTVEFIDPVTGEATAHFAPPQGGSSVYVDGDGRAIVTSYDHRAWLVAP